MELTINIKEDNKILFFLNLMQEFEYIEILDVKENKSQMPVGHKELLKKRLERIENGKTSFRSWDLVKEKYAAKEA